MKVGILNCTTYFFIPNASYCLMAISNSIKATLWMFGALMSFTAMAVAGREVASELDTFEIMMYRSLIGLFIVLGVGGFAGSLVSISRQRFGLHVVRNFCHFTGQNLWFYALTMIPLAQVFAFEFSSPIWVALLAPFFLGERLTKVRIVTVLVGFIGILIIAQPGMITLNSGVIAAILCAIGFAGTFIATKLLSKTESTTCILFWLVLIQLVMGIGFAFYDADVAVPSKMALPLVVLIGCCGLLAHFCIVMALKFAPVMVIAPIDFLRLPVIALIGASFYNEAINIWIIVGAMIVFGANFFNIWSESKAKSVSTL